MGEYGIIMIDIKICKGSVSTTRPGHVIPTILQFSGAIRIQEVDFPDGKKTTTTAWWHWKDFPKSKVGLVSPHLPIVQYIPRKSNDYDCVTFW